MKLDNPKLTAFALGELSPAEQAILETEILSDREIAAEIDETKEIARILRAGLGAEPAGRLAEHQRDAIFREARILAEEKLAAADSTVTPFAPLVVSKGAWWDRPGPWQAIAACAVAGFAAYAMLINTGRDPSKTFGSPDSEIAVGLPPDSGGGSTQIAAANLNSPPNKLIPGLPAVGGVDPDLKKPSVPKVNGVKPEDMKVDVPTQIVKHPEQAPPQPEEALNPVKDGPKFVIRKDDFTGASVAKKQPTINDETVATYVRARLAEVGEMPVGTTYEQFSKAYRPVPGIAGQYELIRSPSIKVDATFVPGSVQPQGATPAADSRLKSISKPYLE